MVSQGGLQFLRMLNLEEFEYHIDASTFQKPLLDLAEVLAQKVNREGKNLLPSRPIFVATDIFVLVRLAMRTYDLLFYINADERRQNDCFWRPVYTMVSLPLVRNMIDCLFNVTLILQDPAHNGALFRKSGFKRALNALDGDEKRYGGEPKWDEWIRRNRDGFDVGIRVSGLTMSEVLAETNSWPTMGKYIGDKRPGGSFSPHQDFLRTFTFGRWREYSAMAHGAFEGLFPVAMYFIPDSFPHEERPKLDATYPKILSMHMLRSAGILLCIVTELQLYFRFDDSGARINERIHSMWNVLMPVFEVKELYEERYKKLLEERGINP